MRLLLVPYSEVYTALFIECTRKTVYLGKENVILFVNNTNYIIISKYLKLDIC
jgi:hypothetical protein